MHCHYLRVGEYKACCNLQRKTLFQYFSDGARTGQLRYADYATELDYGKRCNYYSSFFLSFSVWSSVYLLIAGTEVNVAHHHTQTHHTRYDSSG